MIRLHKSTLGRTSLVTFFAKSCHQFENCEKKYLELFLYTVLGNISKLLGRKSIGRKFPLVKFGGMAGNFPANFNQQNFDPSKAANLLVKNFLLVKFFQTKPKQKNSFFAKMADYTRHRTYGRYAAQDIHGIVTRLYQINLQLRFALIWPDEQQTENTRVIGRLLNTMDSIVDDLADYTESRIDLLDGFEMNL